MRTCWLPLLLLTLALPALGGGGDPPADQQAAAGVMDLLLAHTDGTPRAGVQIEVEDVVIGSTGADGRARVHLAPGSWVLAVEQGDGPGMGTGEWDDADLHLRLRPGASSTSGGRDQRAEFIVRIDQGTVSAVDLEISQAGHSFGAESGGAVGPTPYPSGVLHGRVLAGRGAPVAGARIYALGWFPEAITDEEGRFELGLPQGSYDLRIEAPGVPAVLLAATPLPVTRAFAREVARSTRRNELRIDLDHRPLREERGRPGSTEPFVLGRPEGENVEVMGVDWCTWQAYVADHGQRCLHILDLRHGSHQISCERSDQPVSEITSSLPSRLDPLQEDRSGRAVARCAVVNMAPYGFAGRGVDLETKCAIRLDDRKVDSDGSYDTFDVHRSITLRTYLVEPPAGTSFLIAVGSDEASAIVRFEHVPWTAVGLDTAYPTPPYCEE
ncbi:MAG: carboxypeptidase regulatory-like domain-containing protein [Deltaproteobacteria bacterium]|nr:carboxypeptidase regulatory-like domain-containing protein [Deltaproteobacteria bacterium]